MPVVETNPTENLETYEDFRAGFRLSAKANWWRHWQGRTLTLFRRNAGYAYCIASAGGKLEYSPGTYPDQ